MHQELSGDFGTLWLLNGSVYFCAQEVNGPRIIRYLLKPKESRV